MISRSEPGAGRVAPDLQHLDAIIVGGGHNGLTCAAYLAGAGLKVLVLEKNAAVGGAAFTEEFHPGFRNSVAAYTVSLLNPKVIADLELARHGLRIVHRPAANFWPVDDKRYLLMRGGLAERQAAVAQFSQADAERLPAYDAMLERAADVLRDLVLTTPPNAGGGITELIKGAGLGRRMMALGLDEKRVLLDLFTRSASDFLDGWFESDVVKAAFAFDGIVGNYAAPSTPGTAYVLLHHCFGEVNGKRGAWGHAIGGMGAISAALAAAATQRGALIRTDAKVARIITRNDAAVGVELADGEQIFARTVVANVPPKLLFRDLIAPDAVPSETRAQFTGMKAGSGTFRMNVALSELPDFICRPGTQQQDHHGAGIVIGPTLDYLERAYLDARLEGWSREPVVEMLIPSTLDDTLAPPGQHVASLFVQHVAPHLPAGRSWANAHEKAAFADVVINTVNRHAPNFAASVVGRQVLSPLDLENRFGMVDGDIFHGALSLDQLFSARPRLGFADYRLPLAGLYLCGSGAHPGGGVTGAPGHNAAREILRDLSGPLRAWTRRSRHKKG
ncbi:phytoene desaturase family protein [Hyphomicrobium sulfonivorans]|uniref:phytoene desaturase family protein n=1 Tax=Hyphomicrobium sulfonivorans TaxID=121290 RepID=UPI001570F590|nr:NAD(P)/FAD-dependent oxidoreductase [Hyphomicrobium sulfonivorans]MBI1649958.1 NAD(P)/FAD-dependent oxidoreductase [Hyphomicrobium sulfonivorans]NSL72875.1 FAD-dependent oxidoreductase [Hyphomicrobium sulfonivorans]